MGGRPNIEGGRVLRAVMKGGNRRAPLYRGRAYFTCCYEGGCHCHWVVAVTLLDPRLLYMG